VVKCLLCKWETLNSNPRPTKKKEKKKLPQLPQVSGTTSLISQQLSTSSQDTPPARLQLTEIPNDCKHFLAIKYVLSWAWWCMPVIPELGRLRQEAHEFKASLGFIGKPYLKKKCFN
jgi:hypothetical protein